MQFHQISKQILPFMQHGILQYEQSLENSVLQCYATDDNVMQAILLCM